MKIIIAILTLCVTLPIWYFLLYGILKRVDASDAMWFAFWIYIPVGAIASMIDRLSREQ